MSNEFAKESSPYLRQHADNPVDWLPWSQRALDLAGEQNKPIQLSPTNRRTGQPDVVNRQTEPEPRPGSLNR
ncbi:MAG: DUF255 domain-containing protein [Gammaproteobacteria bacterium]|nr:DUF255 domain-containing protein [Gammaproteobacteria bacterium]